MGTASALLFSRIDAAAAAAPPLDSEAAALLEQQAGPSAAPLPSFA